MHLAVVDDFREIVEISRIMNKHTFRIWFYIRRNFIGFLYYTKVSRKEIDVPKLIYFTGCLIKVFQKFKVSPTLFELQIR